MSDEEYPIDMNELRDILNEVVELREANEIHVKCAVNDAITIRGLRGRVTELMDDIVAIERGELDRGL